MENVIVKYNNALNEISFKDFTENDFNLFMAICSRMKELGESVQQIEYSYIMDLVSWDKRQRVDLFHEELMRMSDKLRKVGATINISNDEFISFNLFSTFQGNRKKKILRIRTNPDFRYILNDLTKNFTRFELREYVGLDGKYSKLLYQHLKQFRATGWWTVSVEDFRRELAIPDTYMTKHINDKVLKPTLAVLRSCKGFSDLTVEKIHKDGRGRSIIGFKFKWTPEDQIPGQMTLEDYESGRKRKPQKKKENSFSDFEQREYDYTELERQLLQGTIKS